MLGWEATRIQLGPVEHVGVEDREESAEVERTEDRSAVEQDQVLICGTTADVEGRREVRCRNHARQHLDCTDRVGFSDSRQLLQIGEADLADGRPSDLLETDALPAAHGLDRDALDLDGLAFESEVVLAGLPPRHGDLLDVFGVP
jgi:hypothetical protein